MTVVVRLLGEPRIEVDGEPSRAPRGHKAWALLAFVVLAERPPSRRAVADVLFNDANDPLAALRWTLSEIRRATGWTTADLGGDPLVIRLATEDRIDLLELVASPTVRLGEVASGRLLGSLAFDRLPVFDYWLRAQQLKLSGREQAQLRDDVLADLASGRIDEAVRRAHRLVELDPLECRNQEALLRSLAAAGRGDEALRHLARCEDLFARELDAPVPRTLRVAAAQPATVQRLTRAVTATAEARARLESGRAAIGAGATDRGLDRLRGAVALARESTDPVLNAEALLQYGEALAHGAQDRTTEVTAVLHRAIAAAHQADRFDFASRACSELGFIHIQIGDAGLAHYWLNKAAEQSHDEDRLLAVINGLRGLAHSDGAHYERSLCFFDLSIEQAQRAGKARQVAWSLSMAARTHLLRGDVASALNDAESSIEIAQSEHWAALLPWPQSQRGEILRLQGHVEQAGDQLEGAYALAREVGDLCWASVACRSLAAVASDRGDDDAAHAWTDRSLEHSLPYVWILAHALEGKCEVTRSSNEDTSRTTAYQLQRVAAHSELREYSVRAAVRLGDLGDEHAGAAARLLGLSIDNPSLQTSAERGVPL
ncbi:MAG: BTAD domain-containing putative transcriptional regulator [Acidimicrobiales bacterium]